MKVEVIPPVLPALVDFISIEVGEVFDCASTLYLKVTAQDAFPLHGKNLWCNIRHTERCARYEVIKLEIRRV